MVVRSQGDVETSVLVLVFFFFFTMVHSKENVSHLHLIYAFMNVCMFRTQSFNNSNCPYHGGGTVCFLLFSLTKKKKRMAVTY